MKTLILSLVVAACPYLSLAQGSLKLSGKVADGESGGPLTYASVSLKGKSVGTVTNADGMFDFHILTPAVDDTLVISILGYTSYETPVNALQNKGQIVVRLKIKPIQLEEVVVTDTKLTLKDIVAKAYENIEINYPLQPYVYQCFYRETHQENNKSIMLVEASLDVYDKGYKALHLNRHQIREKVNLNNVRASNNYRNPLFKNTAVENSNLVISALSNNLVKYRKADARTLNHHTYTLERIVYSNEDLIYVSQF